MKLTPLLLPSSTWGVNLRNLLGKKWHPLARQIYKRDSYKCRLCGGKGHRHPVECHEEWQLNEKERTLTLVGFISLCPKCHMVQHAGFHFSQGRGNTVLNHLRLVNGITLVEAQKIIQKAHEDWAKREKLGEWTVIIPSHLIPKEEKAKPRVESPRTRRRRGPSSPTQ